MAILLVVLSMCILGFLIMLATWLGDVFASLDGKLDRLIDELIRKDKQ